VTDDALPETADRLRYRLRQVDTDGTVHLNDPVTVTLGAPEELALHGPAPNPVRNGTTLRYDLPRDTKVTIALYDLMGRRVRTLVQGGETAGRKQARLDVSGLAAGTYFVRMRADGTTRTRKVTVVK
jgi:hypothetical protein